MRFLVLLVLISLPGFASAQAWTSCESDVLPQPRVEKPGACAQYTLSGDTDSAILTTTVPTTWEFDPDTGATDEPSGTLAEIHIRRCATATASTSACAIFPVDHDGDGTWDYDTLNGDNGASSGEQRRWRWSVPPGIYYIDVTAGPDTGEDAVVRVTASWGR